MEESGYSKIKHVDSIAKRAYLIKPLSPVHEYLDHKIPWYHKWHQRPNFNKIHWATLALYIVVVILGTFSAAFVLPYKPARAAYTCTSASAGEGTWSDVNTWANCNGGIPGAEDSVVIAVDSPVYMEYNETITSLTVNDGAELSLYGNTLTVTGDVDIEYIIDASGATLKVGGNFTMPYLNSMGNIYNTSFSGSTIEFTSASAGKTIDFGGAYPNTPNNLTFSGSGGWSLSNNTTIGGNLSLTDAAADLDINGKNLTVTGTLSNLGTLKMTGGETTVSLTNDTDSGTIEYYGTSGPYTTKNLTYYNLKINGAATTFNQYNGNITANGTFNLAAGTYAQGGNDLTVKKDFTIVSGATFTKATSGAKKVKLLGDLTYTDGNSTKQNLGTLEIGASPDTTTLATDLVADSLTIGAGDVLNTMGYDLDIGGNVVINTGSPGGTIDTTDNGTLGYEGDGTNINVAGNFTINSGGVFTKCVQSNRHSKIIMDGGATKTLTSDGDDLGDLQTSTISTHIDLQDALIAVSITIDNSTTLDTTSSNRALTATNITIGTSGTTATLLGNGSTLNISGAWDALYGTYTSATSTLKLTGGSIKDRNSYPWNAYNNVEMGLGGSTTTLLSGIACNMFTLGTGTVTDGASSFALYVQKTGNAFVDNGGSLTIATFYYRCPGGFSQNVVARDYSAISTLGFYGVGGATGSINYNMQGNIIANAIVIGPNNSGTGTNVDILNTNNYSLTAASIGVGKATDTNWYGKINAGSSTIDINGDVTIQSSAANGNNEIDAGTSTWNVSGNWTNNDIFTASGSNIIFDKSSGTQTLNSGGVVAAKTFNNLTHSGAGTLQLLTNSINIDGVLTNSSGTFNTNSLDMTVAGNVDLTTGSFTQGTRTITLDGAAAQSFTAGGTGAGHTPYNITVTNPSASGVTFTDSLTLASGGTLTAATPSSKLTFTDGASYNFPLININGSGAGDVTMTKGAGAHGHFHFIVPGTPTVTYVTVDHSDATGSGAQIDATNNSHDGTGNTYWNFGNTAPNTPLYSDLSQKKTDNTVIATGDWVSATSIKFVATADDLDDSDTLYLCIDYTAIDGAFADEFTCSASGTAYSGTPVEVTYTVDDILVDTEYHWQAKIKDAAGVYSNAVSYGNNSEGEFPPNADRDFGLDTSAPTSGTVNDGTSGDVGYNNGSLSTLSANWGSINSNVSGLSKYEYAIGTTSGATDTKTWTNNGTDTTITDTGLTLRTGQSYYFSIRTTDNAGNISTPITSNGQAVASTLTFSYSGASIEFDTLNSGNSYTDSGKSTALQTSTNAYGGYVIKARVIDKLRMISNPSIFIDFFNAGNSLPLIWSGEGFGYTTSDSNLSGGTADRFTSGGPKYAGWIQTGPGDPVADHTATVVGTPITNEEFTIGYRVTGSATTPAGRYSTTIIYTAIPQY